MAETFIRKSLVQASAETLSKWHHANDVFHRIQPPWESARIVKKAKQIADGLEEHIQIQMGPLKKTWIARYQDVVKGGQFCDLQVSGPFKFWFHKHIFHDNGDGTSTLEDNISYTPPMGRIGSFLAGNMVRKKLDMMFQYRHRVTVEDVKRHHNTEVKSKNILITGGTGLVGSQLAPLLKSMGHKVFLLTRSPKQENHIGWSLKDREIDSEKLKDIEVVINLAGASIASLWTKKNKEKIYSSRVEGTKFLVESLLKFSPKLENFLSASGSGVYPLNTGDIYDESGPSGNTFLGKLATDWEAAANPLAEKGIRVAHFRIGVVISSLGGALQKMILPGKFCLGGPWGKGTQHMSWIAIDDLTDILTFAVSDESYRGAINAVAKESITVNDFFKTLGRVLKRPQLFRVPSFVMKSLPGDMGKEVFLGDNRTVPGFLNSKGYEYRHENLESALRLQLGTF